jgi:hypothetical protein
MHGNGVIMTTPVFKGRRRESHLNFFYAVNFLEARLGILLNDHERVSIQQVFQVIPPVMKNQIELTFGGYLEDLDAIARKYGCEVNPWAPALRDAKITPEIAYAMSVNFAKSAFMNIKNIAGLEQLIPVVKDVHALLDTYAEFEQKPAQRLLNLKDSFVRSAMMNFRSVHDQLSDFDEVNGEAVAARSVPKLSIKFQANLGEIYDSLVFQATLMKGRAEGLRQAELFKVKEFDGAPDGP